MRLFHISEESSIEIFKPRIPKRSDLNQSCGLVWAIEERCLANFLTPRDCPRVAYHANPDADPQELARFFSSPASPYVVAIEHGWVRRMREAALHLYEFNPSGFTLQDKTAGYHTSTDPQIPIGHTVIDNVFEALAARNVELRILPELWPLADAVRLSGLYWSLCRMSNALPRTPIQSE